MHFYHPDLPVSSHLQDLSQPHHRGLHSRALPHRLSRGLVAVLLVILALRFMSRDVNTEGLGWIDCR